MKYEVDSRGKILDFIINFFNIFFLDYTLIKSTSDNISRFIYFFDYFNFNFISSFVIFCKILNAI